VRVSRLAPLFLCAACLTPAEPTFAQWSIETESNIFYTDDVSLFSASRRLALMEDPTQPVVDVTNQGSDMVVEPSAEVKRIFSSALGRTELSIKAQGFAFVTKSIYNHATFRFELEQDLTRALLLRLNYYYAPDLFLWPATFSVRPASWPTNGSARTSTARIWRAALRKTSRCGCSPATGAAPTTRRSRTETPRSGPSARTWSGPPPGGWT